MQEGYRVQWGETDCSHLPAYNRDAFRCDQLHEASAQPGTWRYQCWLALDEAKEHPAPYPPLAYPLLSLLLHGFVWG